MTASIAFCTRLPLVGATPIAGSTIAKAAWAFPIAGLVVGIVGAVVYALAHRAGVPAWPAAALAVAATLLATGCLHEDGLADTADGFGGGKTREQKLDIMRDSRIGVYGVCALIMSLLLRVGAAGELARCACRRLGADRIACRRARDHAGTDVCAAAGAQRRPVVRGRPAAGRKRRRRAR